MTFKGFHGIILIYSGNFLRKRRSMGWVYVKRNKTKAHELGHWKQAKKLEVVSIYIATGSPTLTAQQTGVPLPTIEDWQRSNWWKDAVLACRSGENDKLDAKLTKAIDKALDNVMDRLEEGDWVYDQKTGKVKRCPVKLRDVNHAFNTLTDKRQLIRKLPTKITEASNTEAKLKQLAQQFADFTKTRKPEEKLIELIEGDTVVKGEDGVYEVIGNAIHVQRPS